MTALRILVPVAALGVLLTLRSSHPEHGEPVSVSIERPAEDTEDVQEVEAVEESPDEIRTITREEFEEKIRAAIERGEAAARSIDNPGCMWPPAAFGEPRFRDPYGPLVPPRAEGK